MQPATRYDNQPAVKELLTVLLQSQTAFHATQSLKDYLDRSGFEDWTNFSAKQLAEKLQLGAKAYFRQNNSSLLAFRVGQAPLDHGIRLIGSHTDSPGIKLKPQALMEREGMLLLDTEIYGGPILNTWKDRPLSLAGRLVYECQGQPQEVLVDFQSIGLLLSLPNLAIHMNREVNQGLPAQRQKEYLPVLSLSRQQLWDSLPQLLQQAPAFALERLQQLQAKMTAAGEDASAQLPPLSTLWQLFLSALLPTEAEDLLDYELYLYDTTPPSFLGFSQEFLQASHWDNIASSQASLAALVEAEESKLRGLQVVYCADNEEVGSRSMQGANSLYLRDQLERLYLALGGQEADFLHTLSHSFHVSCDQAHALHPHYPEVTDPQNRPLMGKGPVIKYAASLSYATDAHSAALFKLCCKQAGVNCQSYANHSDRPGGSTIGPLSTVFLHCPTVDVGIPIWGMHSIRETAHVQDHLDMIAALKAFFEGDWAMLRL